jgi:3-hydroxyisobutyrate dehydrogenase-like beta-hydroxyacid dehydrogenase
MDVGFVGLGHMGGPMATNVLAAGHRLAVCDVRREAGEPLEEAGATWAATPAEAARGAEAVLLSLPMPADVEEVVTGPGGVLAGAAPGTTVVDLSTNDPLVSRRLAERAAGAGLGFLDAPVSGGVRGARKGTLAVMVGGDAALFERVRPVLDAIGANVFHVGDVGAGGVVKLINNMLAFVNMLAVTEGLVLGAKAGVDPKVLRDIVQAGSGGSFMWESGTSAILRDRLAPSFTVNLASKDIGLAVGLAAELGVPVPMGEHARHRIEHYRATGFAEEDILASVRAIEEQAGVVVRGTGI